MIFGSMCSGIEAASVAWKPLGWRPAFFAETEKFPSAVLNARHGGVPNLGDITTDSFKAALKEYAGNIDVLVAGTPCQSFSIAGERAGLDDPRGNLTLEFLAHARRLRAQWLVWENVPGVLSHDGGRTFGIILGLLAECGYGFAYRILDAQYFNLAQRRERVFVVGYLGDWRPPAAVLFERHSLSGYPAPRREAGESVAATIRGGTEGGRSHGRQSGTDAQTLIPEVSLPISAEWDGYNDGCDQTYLPEVAWALQERDSKGCDSKGCDSKGCDSKGCDSDTKEGHLIPLCFDTTQISSPSNRSNPNPGDPCHPLAALAHAPAVAFTERTRIDGRNFESQEELSYALTNPGSGGRPHSRAIMDRRMAVRRLTPRECERLMGFEDDYTLIPYGGKGKLAKDSPRHKALGNSMPVPVMRWIGARIQMVSQLLHAS